MPMGFYARNLEAPLEQSKHGIEWEEIGCLLCGGIRWSPLVEAPDHVCCRYRIRAFERALEAALADEAPGADHVGDDVDVQGRLLRSGHSA